MDEEIPASAKNAAKVAVISSIIIGVILIIAVIAFFFRPRNTQTNSNVTSPSASPIPSLSQISDGPTGSPTIPSNSNGVQIYSSKTLGIQFNYNVKAYIDDPNSTETTKVVESKNRITLHPSSLPADQGQFIEVFDKQANETLENAIQRQFLAGKDKTRCQITTSQDGRRTTAEITFPQDPNGSVDAFFDNSVYCSPDYAQTNGLRYFMYDPISPTKFYFISVGQYGILAEESIPWHNTIQIIN